MVKMRWNAECGKWLIAAGRCRAAAAAAAAVFDDHHRHLPNLPRPSTGRAHEARTKFIVTGCLHNK